MQPCAARSSGSCTDRRQSLARYLPFTGGCAELPLFGAKVFAVYSAVSWKILFCSAQNILPSLHILSFLYFLFSHHENTLTFRGVARWLAQHDILLIVRVPCALHNSTLVNDQFWALVPPASAVAGNNNELQVESSVLSRSSASKADSSARGASPWDYMQLLKLVDSDDILVPRINQAGRSLSASSYPTPSISNISPVQRAHGDVLDPPHSAPEQATPEKQVAQQEPEEDEDELMMQDVAEYLQASLERSLGTPEKYNPMLCASGTINNLVRIYSDIFC